jgi:Polyketide cyclase / dehydrase and lipid transport
VQIVLTALANAPPDIAFQTTADIPAWPKFVSAIETIELMTPGTVGPGTRFRQTRVMFGRKATEEMKVAEMLPSRRLVLTAYNHGTAYRVEHAFAPEAAGTRMTLNSKGSR